MRLKPLPKPSRRRTHLKTGTKIRIPRGFFAEDLNGSCWAGSTNARSTRAFRERVAPTRSTVKSSSNCRRVFQLSALKIASSALFLLPCRRISWTKKKMREPSRCSASKRAAHISKTNALHTKKSTLYKAYPLRRRMNIHSVVLALHFQPLHDQRWCTRGANRLSGKKMSLAQDCAFSDVPGPVRIAQLAVKRLRSEVNNFE